MALGAGAWLTMSGSSERYARLIPAEARPLVLSQKELAVLFAPVDRRLPDAPGFPTAREARIAERIDKELTFHPAQFQSDVCQRHNLNRISPIRA